MPASMVVTGSSSGIGAAAAIELTRQGHAVLATGRSQRKLADVHRRMRATAPAGLSVPEPAVSDLSTLEGVRRFAALVLERCPGLTVLANNAAVQPVVRQESGDGIELGLAVNHLAPFLLTELLGERLAGNGGRVVNTSSDSHVDGRFDFGDLQLRHGWTPELSYGRSKLANILFTHELRRRTGLTSCSFHPGEIRTDINRDAPWLWLTKPFERFRYDPPAVGAVTLVWLATVGQAPDADYYVDRAPHPTSEDAADPELAARLWEASAAMITEAAG